MAAPTALPDGRLAAVVPMHDKIEKVRAALNKYHKSGLFEWTALGRMPTPLLVGSSCTEAGWEHRAWTESKLCKKLRTRMTGLAEALHELAVVAAKSIDVMPFLQAERDLRLAASLLDVEQYFEVQKLSGRSVLVQLDPACCIGTEAVELVLDQLGLRSASVGQGGAEPSAPGIKPREIRARDIYSGSQGWGLVSRSTFHGWTASGLEGLGLLKTARRLPGGERVFLRKDVEKFIARSAEIRRVRSKKKT